MRAAVRTVVLLRPKYLGLVATRGMVPIQKNAGLTAWMNRSMHIATDNITSLQLIYPNWYADSSGEHAVGAASTITASIEYPAGVFTQVKFGGVNQGSIPDGGNVITDTVNVAIPKGVIFWARCYITNSSGIIFALGNIGYSTTNRPTLTDYTTPSDQTMGGTVIAQSLAASYGPLAIIGQTRRPSVLLAGDSRTMGYDDLPDIVTGDIGETARSLNALFGYVNAGISGELGESALAHYAKRATILPYVTHVIDQYGINDLNLSRSAATTAATRASLATTTFTGKVVLGTTLAPFTTSTDSWATAGNQTPTSINAARVTFNGLVRTGIAGEVGYFDIADAVETSRDSGKWITTGVANAITPDGVHETAAGNALITAAGVIQPGRIRP